MKYKDIVVVGAGLGGLASAVTLAKKGYKVTVIEKHFIPGGYATNFVRKTKDGQIFNFDASLHGIGDLNKDRYFYKRLEDLGITEKVNFIRKKETGTVVLEDGSYFDIPDEFLKYKEVLIEKFPNEKEGIERLFSFLKAFDEDMEISVYREGNFPKYVQQLENISLYNFLKQYVDNEEFISVFSFLWPYYGLPEKEINAYFYLIAWLTYHIGGTYYIEGGANAFSQAFVSVIKENGGNIILKEEVIKLNTKENKIISIETNKGNTFFADIFIINGCIENVLNQIDDITKIESYMQNIKSRPHSTSLTQLYIGTDKNPVELGLTKSDYFFYSEIYNKEDIEKAKEKNYNDAFYAIVNYNLLDPNLNKETGYIAITIIDNIENWAERDTEAYKAQKKEVTEILLKKLYDNFPKVAGHVVLTELATPRTMQRYTNNKCGAVYGFAQDLKNGNFNRLPCKTCLDNTYIASAWTFPGGGFIGAIISACYCVELVLKSLKVEYSAKEDISINPDTFMQGMLLRADKEYIKDLALNYKFSFTDINKEYFIKISNDKASMEKVLTNIDAEVICSFKTWLSISNGKKDGELAFRTGELKVKGSLEKFLYIPKIFSSNNKHKKEAKDEKEEQKLFKGDLLIPIFLVPWIIYWLFGAFIPYAIGYFAIIYTVVLGYFIKPRFAKEITLLEYVTIFSFTLYNFLLNIMLHPKYYYFEIILPIALFISCFREPMTAQYSKWRYKKSITKTKLFKDINAKITFVWGIIFLLNFLIAKVVFVNSFLSIFIYLTNIVGIVFSIKYPKKIMV